MVICGQIKLTILHIIRWWICVVACADCSKTDHLDFVILYWSNFSFSGALCIKPHSITKKYFVLLNSNCTPDIRFFLLYFEALQHKILYYNEQSAAT